MLLQVLAVEGARQSTARRSVETLAKGKALRREVGSEHAMLEEGLTRSGCCGGSSE
jgi:hypothetical protein